MSGYVIDASVAVKWVVEEEGTADALTILGNAGLCAPDLLIAECADILWKKVRLDELSGDEASIKARFLEQVELELVPTRNLLGSAVSLAVEFDHPAYDCIYLALALKKNRQFVTADRHFRRKILGNESGRYSDFVLSLPEAAAASAED